jgi:hypothetical protein
MNRFLSFIASPAGLIYLFMLVAHPLEGLYLARGVEVPGLYSLMGRLTFFWLIGWWVLKDSRRHGFKLVYDMGFFLFIAWPLILPYYLFKTRGIKALLTILSFLAVYVGTYVMGVLAYAIFSS